MTPREFVNDLKSRMEQYRFTYNDEAALQWSLVEFFASEGIPIEREYRLSAEDRPDFAYKNKGGGLILIEVKVDHAVTSHLRQVWRYAANPSVQAVVLLSPSGRGVPPVIGSVELFHIPIIKYSLT